MIGYIIVLISVFVGYGTLIYGLIKPYIPLWFFWWVIINGCVFFMVLSGDIWVAIAAANLKLASMIKLAFMIGKR